MMTSQFPRLLTTLKTACDTTGGVSGPHPKLKTARLNVPLNIAMQIVAEESLPFDDRRFPESLTRPGITAHYAVPMAWVSVPYLEGSEAELRATLARIAPEAVPLGLCVPEGLPAVTMADDPSLCPAPGLCEGSPSLSEASRSDSPSSPLSASGCGESCEEVKFPCAEAAALDADVNPQPEGES